MYKRLDPSLQGRQLRLRSGNLTDADRAALNDMQAAYKRMNDPKVMAELAGRTVAANERFRAETGFQGSPMRQAVMGPAGEIVGSFNQADTGYNWDARQGYFNPATGQRATTQEFGQIGLQNAAERKRKQQEEALKKSRMAGIRNPTAPGGSNQSYTVAPTGQVTYQGANSYKF